MKDFADYLAYIKALIVMNSQVAHWVVAREESQGNRGLFRYRLTLRDGCLLDVNSIFQCKTEASSYLGDFIRFSILQTGRPAGAVYAHLLQSS